MFPEGSLDTSLPRIYDEERLATVYRHKSAVRAELGEESYDELEQTGDSVIHLAFLDIMRTELKSKYSWPIRQVRAPALFSGLYGETRRLHAISIPIMDAIKTNGVWSL